MIFPLACVQTGSGAHPAFCTIGTRGPLPEYKARPGRDADHSHLVPRSRMSRSYTSSPLKFFMVCSVAAAFEGKYRWEFIMKSVVWLSSQSGFEYAAG
jgi:hypothetical protein